MIRETSIAAYRDLEQSGALSRLRLLVARDIAYNGPTTAGESCRRLQEGRPPKYRDSLSQRFSELENFGVIRVTGKRLCRVTDHECVEWDLTGQMPIQPARRPTRVERERLACIEIVTEVEIAAQTEQEKRAAREIAGRILARGSKT